MLKKFTRMFSTVADVQTIAGHRPPAPYTEIPSGRYATSLFSAASKSNCLTDVKEDLLHLGEVIKATPSFRDTLNNSAIRRSLQRQIFGTFVNENYHQITLTFLNVIIDAGRYL